jgi:hypothetical protein
LRLKKFQRTNSSQIGLTEQYNLNASIYTFFFANKTRSSYGENFLAPTATHLTIQVEASGVLTDKSVSHKTGLFVPRTNLQPKCVSALNILGCSERVSGTSVQSFHVILGKHELMSRHLFSRAKARFINVDVYCSSLTHTA